MEKIGLSRFSFWIGRRFLQSKKSDRFLSFITMISVGGVGIGVTALIVVMSVMDGFEQEQKKRFMQFESHLIFEPTSETSGFDQGFFPEEVLQQESLDTLIKQQGPVESIEGVLITEVMLRVGSKVTGVTLRGVSGDSLERFQSQITENLDTRALSPEKKSALEDGTALRLWIGKELAYELGVVVGDEIVLILPIDQDGPAGNIPKMRKFILQGIFESGMAQQELHQVVTDHRSFRNFLRRKGILSRVEVHFKNFEQVVQYSTQLKKLNVEKNLHWRIRDYKDLNQQLFASLRLERVAMFVSLLFIVVVASFNIVSTLSLMVIKKRKEISILKAMGASNRQVAGIFLSEGLLIGGMGVIGGGLVAFIVSLLLKRYEIIELPDVYYDRTLPITMDPLYYGGVGLAAFCVIILACWYPCRRALHYQPIEGIRRG